MPKVWAYRTFIAPTALKLLNAKASDSHKISHLFIEQMIYY